MAQAMILCAKALGMASIYTMIQVCIYSGPCFSLFVRHAPEHIRKTCHF